MKKFKFLAALSVLAALVFSSLAPGVDAAISAASSDDGSSVSDSYIVVLKGDRREMTDEFAARYQVRLTQRYEQIFNGFAGRISPERLARLKNDPDVLYIAEDKIVTIANHANAPVALAQTVPTGVLRTGANVNPNKGDGIGVAVIDTGIDLDHPDLNVGAGKSCVSGARKPDDDNGHGTHVAGSIAAKNNTTGVVGVASGARVHPVKVLNRNGSGTWSQVICGIDWVTANAARYNIRIANMSLGGPGASDNNCGLTNNDPLHQAICRARDAGVTFVVAAGNSAANTNATAPASYNDAVITISALADSDGLAGGTGPATAYGADDTFATFSNFGAEVDLGAPGVNIYSTFRNGGYATMSGTSMASPHAAGAAALYVKSNPGATWVQVRQGLQLAAEALGAGHTDPSGKHPEPVLKAGTL